VETANAFDMLISPILQWFAGMIAALPILQALRFGVDRLFAKPANARAGRIGR
jgi:hypothetical protein